MSLSLFFQSATVSDGGKSHFLMSIFIIFNNFSNCGSVFAMNSLTIGVFFAISMGGGG